MGLKCVKTTEWIEEEVSKPVEEWVERTEKKCKKRKWYDPRRWVCWFVTKLVKVVRWVVVKVGKWVVRTVCKIVSITIDFLRELAFGLWDIVAGIFTLDWRRILDGLLDILLGAIFTAIQLFRIFALVDTLDYIISEVNKGRLKWYVRQLLVARYAEEDVAAIAKNIRLDYGAFGLRLNGRVIRSRLDSETLSTQEPGIPNLVVLHENGLINLRALCGFEFDERFLRRKRYKTLKKGPFVTGGGGFGELDNPISESELNEYLSSRGTRGPAFIVLPVRDGPMGRHISTAEEKGRELCVMLDFDTESADTTEPAHIVHNESQNTNVSVLTSLAGRTNKVNNRQIAVSELCQPTAVVVFRYTQDLFGLASNLETSNCGLPGMNASGISYVDARPDRIMKFVLIHEFGHYFGLCHTDGIDRIMFSSKESSWWRWQAIPNLVLGKGEPYFTYSEAQATWDYIVDNFTPECLGAPARPIVQ